MWSFTFSGYVATQPEIRYTEAGVPVANLRVIRTARYQRNGQWVDGATVAIDLACWRQLAEHVVNCLRPGDPVLVEVGDNLEARTYGDRTYLQARCLSVAVVMGKHGASSHKPAKGTTDSPTWTQPHQQPVQPQQQPQGYTTQSNGYGQPLPDYPAAHQQQHAQYQPAHQPQQAPEQPHPQGGTHRPGDIGGRPTGHQTRPQAPAPQDDTTGEHGGSTDDAHADSQGMQVVPA